MKQKMFVKKLFTTSVVLCAHLLNSVFVFLKLTCREELLDTNLQELQKKTVTTKGQKYHLYSVKNISFCTF